jgi:thiosulfate dehydrogenase (quinone) large subunit
LEEIMTTSAAPRTTESPVVNTTSRPTAAVAEKVGKVGPVAFAALRIATGFIFLWAFLDKTFGLGYSTPTDRAWINGGSPTNGFLSHLEAGPLKGFFNAIAGNWLTDTLFMLGLLGVGVAVIAGAGLRISAVVGSFMMLMMWLAEWPLAAGSTNPVVDYHIIYALVLIVVAAYGAGRYFGVGNWWSSLSFVQRNPWLK